MGKRSRELSTGLTLEQRVKHSIEEKIRRQKEQKRRDAEAMAEVARQILLLNAKRAEEEEKNKWANVP